MRRRTLRHKRERSGKFARSKRAGMEAAESELALHGIAASWLAAGSAGPERGTMVEGRPNPTSGVAIDARDAPVQARNRFSLRVAIAREGSRASLRNLRIRMAAAGRRVVFDRELTAPPLPVVLAVGRHTVRSLSREAPQARTRIGASDRGEAHACSQVPAPTRCRRTRPIGVELWSRGALPR